MLGTAVSDANAEEADHTCAYQARESILRLKPYSSGRMGVSPIP
jgi:hypothetical protein